MISDAVAISLISSVTIVTSMYVKHLLDKMDRKVERVHETINVVEKKIDGRMDEILELTRKNSKQEGKDQEKEDQAARDKEKK